MCAANRNIAKHRTTFLPPINPKHCPPNSYLLCDAILNKSVLYRFNKFCHPRPFSTNWFSVKYTRYASPSTKRFVRRQSRDFLLAPTYKTFHPTQQYQAVQSSAGYVRIYMQTISQLPLVYRQPFNKSLLLWPERQWLAIKERIVSTHE